MHDLQVKPGLIILNRRLKIGIGIKYQMIQNRRVIKAIREDYL